MKNSPANFFSWFAMSYFLATILLIGNCTLNTILLVAAIIVFAFAVTMKNSVINDKFEVIDNTLKEIKTALFKEKTDVLKKNFNKDILNENILCKDLHFHK